MSTICTLFLAILLVTTTVFPLNFVGCRLCVVLCLQCSVYFLLITDKVCLMGPEVISIQDGGGMLTSSIRRAHGVRTKVGRLRKHSVLKSDWFSVILTCRKNKY